MKINELKLSRKFNLGNYESVDITISVSPTEDENIQKISKEVYDHIKDIKVMVEQHKPIQKGTTAIID